MMYLCTACGRPYNNFTNCPYCGEYDFDLIPSIDEELEEEESVPISAQDWEIECFNEAYRG